MKEKQTRDRLKPERRKKGKTKKQTKDKDRRQMYRQTVRDRQVAMRYARFQKVSNVVTILNFGFF